MKSNLKIMLPLFCVLIIEAMGFGIVFPLIGPLLMDPHSGLLSADASNQLRNFCYGLTMVCFFIPLLFGAPFFGDLSDRLGRKKVITLCLIFTSMGYLLCALAIAMKSLTFLLIARAMEGFVAGSEAIAQAAILDISSPEKKTVNLSMMTLAGCIGFIIGPLVAGIFSDASLASWFNYTTPFVLAGLLSLLNAIGLWFTVTETHPPKPSQKLQLFRGAVIFIEGFTDLRIRHISIVFLLMQLTWAIYFQVINLALINIYHLLPKQIGYFNGFIGLAFGVTMIYIIRVFLKWFNESQLTLLSMGLLSVGFFLNAFLHALWLQWLFAALVCLWIGMAYACLLSLYSSAVSDEHQGWVMGISGAVMAVAWTTTGLLDTFFNTQSILIPMLLAGILALSTLMVLKNDNTF